MTYTVTPPVMVAVPFKACEISVGPARLRKFEIGFNPTSELINVDVFTLWYTFVFELVDVKFGNIVK